MMQRIFFQNTLSYSVHAHVYVLHSNFNFDLLSIIMTPIAHLHSQLLTFLHWISSSPICFLLQWQQAGDSLYEACYRLWFTWNAKLLQFIAMMP